MKTPRENARLYQRREKVYIQNSPGKNLESISDVQFSKESGKEERETILKKESRLKKINLSNIKKLTPQGEINSMKPPKTGAPDKKSSIVEKIQKLIMESISKKIKKNASKIQDYFSINLMKNLEEEEIRIKKLRGEWFKLTLKYIINMLILWGLTYLSILLQNLDWKYFYKAAVFDIVMTYFAVGLLNVISTAIINQRNVEYSISARRMVEKRNSTRYYIKIIYPIIVYFLYLITRLVISYYEYDRKYQSVKAVKIFFGWMIWVLIFFVIKIFSKGEQEEEKDKLELLDDRVKTAMEKFISYQRDSAMRNRYLSALKGKLVKNDKHLSRSLKEYHKKLIMRTRFNYIKDNIVEEAEKESALGNFASSLNNSRNFANRLRNSRSNSRRGNLTSNSGASLLKMVKKLKNNNLQKSQTRSKAFTGGQFLRGAIFSLFPMIQNSVYMIYQNNYNEVNTKFWWFFFLTIFFITPFIFTSIVNKLNKAYKFQHSMYIILALETSQFLHLNFLVRVPNQIEFNIFVYLPILFVLILVTRLAFNVPAIRLFFRIKEKKDFMKNRKGGKFAQEDSGETKIQNFLKELTALNFGISYVFIYVFTSFTILGCIMIVHWTGFQPRMASIMPDKDSSILYFGILFFFMVVLFVYNLNWIKKKVKKQRIEEVNIEESSIIFLNHNFSVFNFLTIWFVLNFLYVY